MLKITELRCSRGESLSLILEGRLLGPWVEELRVCCQQVFASHDSPVVIDLTSVMFIDAEGKALLARLWREGAELQASGCLTRCIVEEITGVARADQSCRRGENVAEKTARDDM